MPAGSLQSASKEATAKLLSVESSMSYYDSVCRLALARIAADPKQFEATAFSFFDWLGGRSLSMLTAHEREYIFHPERTST